MNALRRGLTVAGVLLLTLTGCANQTLPPSEMQGVKLDESGQYVYRVGTGDVLSVFVWNNPDVSADYAVRPDGKISMALTSAVKAAGMSIPEIESELTTRLSEYIKEPKVTVSLKHADGNMVEQVKVIGHAASPAALPYRHGMTLLDLMIRVNGLSTYADGNSATLTRIINGEETRYPLRLEDLMDDADLSANVDLLPGDVIRIPEAWF